MPKDSIFKACALISFPPVFVDFQEFAEREPLARGTIRQLGVDNGVVVDLRHVGQNTATALAGMQRVVHTDVFGTQWTNDNDAHDVDTSIRVGRVDRTQFGTALVAVGLRLAVCALVELVLAVSGGDKHAAADLEVVVVNRAVECCLRTFDHLFQAIFKLTSGWSVHAPSM